MNITISTMACRSQSDLSQSTHLTSDPEWQQRCEKFVDSFLEEIETKFEVYHMLLENKTIENGQSSSVGKDSGKGVGSVVGTLIGYFYGLPGAGVIGGKFGELAGETVSDRVYGSKRKSLSKLIYHYHENKADQRNILIDAGFQIFSSYECQIMNLSGGKAWQTYVNKFGLDAAHRVINFCADESVDRFGVNAVTKGVVCGKSKRQKPIPINRGLKVKYQETKVTTEDLFTKVGLIYLNNKMYYTKKGEKSNEGNYGYRTLFSWELNSSGGMDKETSNFYERSSKYPEKEYKYVADKVYCSKMLEKLILKFSKTEHATEETVKQVLRDLKDEIEGETTILLEEFRTGEVHEQLKQINEQLSKLNVDDFVKQLREMLNKVETEANRIIRHISEVHEQTSSSNSEDRRRGKAVMFDIGEPVDSFTGRIIARDRLHKMLSRNDGKGRVVICGLGGVGKSELARMHASEHCKEYDSIVWIDAESYNSLHCSFVRLAGKLGVKTDMKKLDIPTERPIIDIVSDVYDELADKKCLFIFDDAQKCRNESKTDEGLKNFLPSIIAKHFHVIITSCTDSWDSSIPRIDLEFFREEETLELLVKLLEMKYEKQGAIDIGKLLDHHPLALQIASAYINNQNITIAEFISAYKEINILELEFPESSMDNSKKTIFTTFKVTLDKIPLKGGTEAIAILKMLAYLDPDNIPKHIFSGLGEDIKIRNAIQVLKRYLVITQKSNEQFLKIHKLVQAVIRQVYKDSEESVLGKALNLLQLKIQESKNTEYEIAQRAEYIWHYAGSYCKLIKQYQNVLRFPLHKAAQLKQLQMVKCLIDESDADIYIRDRGGKTALYRANQQDDNVEVIKYLIQEHAQHFNTINKEDWRILSKAVEENKTEVVKFLIEESCADQFLEKNILLHLAAQNGRLDVVMYLINNGADVLCSRSEVTVLHEAVYSNNSDVIEFVLECIYRMCKNKPERKECYINAQDKTGDTPLMWAAKA